MYARAHTALAYIHLPPTGSMLGLLLAAGAEFGRLPSASRAVPATKEVPMAKSGSVIYNKVTLDRFVFRQTREDTDGALLQFDDYHPPNGIGPVPPPSAARRGLHGLERHPGHHD